MIDLQIKPPYLFNIPGHVQGHVPCYIHGHVPGYVQGHVPCLAPLMSAKDVTSNPLMYVWFFAIVVLVSLILHKVIKQDALLKELLSESKDRRTTDKIVISKRKKEETAFEKLREAFENHVAKNQGETNAKLHRTLESLKKELKTLAVKADESAKQRQIISSEHIRELTRLHTKNRSLENDLGRKDMIIRDLEGNLETVKKDLLHLERKGIIENEEADVEKNKLVKIIDEEKHLHVIKQIEIESERDAIRKECEKHREESVKEKKKFTKQLDRSEAECENLVLMGLDIKKKLEKEKEVERMKWEDLRKKNETEMSKLLRKLSTVKEENKSMATKLNECQEWFDDYKVVLKNV